MQNDGEWAVLARMWQATLQQRPVTGEEFIQHPLPLTINPKLRMVLNVLASEEVEEFFWGTR